jgi:hypothetical protein
VSLLGLIMDIQPCCPEEGNAFMTRKIKIIGDGTPKNLGDDLSNSVSLVGRNPEPLYSDAPGILRRHDA